MRFEAIQSAMGRAWCELREQLAAYRLVLPGSASFICQPQTCTAHCCHAFSVSLGEGEAARMTRETGMRMVEFVELEEGKPISLPLARPHLLAREDGHCRFLTPDLGCSAYTGRPNACRLYPHFVVFWDADEHKPIFSGGQHFDRLVEMALEGEVPRPLPLLLGHSECPGFTGPPLSESAWQLLLADTYHMQFEPV